MTGTQEVDKLPAISYSDDRAISPRSVQALFRRLEEMVAQLVAEVRDIRPYHFQTDVFSKDAERLYARFGFRRNEGTWLLDHEPTYQLWGPKAIAEREERRRRTASGR